MRRPCLRQRCPRCRWPRLLRHRWTAMLPRRCRRPRGDGQARMYRQPPASGRGPHRYQATHAGCWRWTWQLSGVPVRARCASARGGACCSVAWPSGRSFWKKESVDRRDGDIRHRAGGACTQHDEGIGESAVGAVGRLAEGARRVASRPEVAVTHRTRRPRPVRPGVGALFQAGMMTRGRRRFSPGRSRPEAVEEGCRARPLPRCPGSRPTGRRR